MFRKKLVFSPRISVNSNENYKLYNFRLLVMFPEISGNIKFPENSQPYI